MQNRVMSVLDPKAARTTPPAVCASPSFRHDVETSRRFSSLPDLPHFEIGALDVAAEPFDVEQGTGEAITREPIAQFLEPPRLPSDPERYGLVFPGVFRHQFGQIERPEEACRHPPRERERRGRDLPNIVEAAEDEAVLRQAGLDASGRMRGN